MTVQDRTMLDAATKLLLRDPGASMSEVAAAAGVSRSTLHSRFPSRQALVLALAHDAMDLLERAYADARLDDGDVRDALARAVTLTIPLGPRLEFLLRERILDEDSELTRRYADLDRPLVDLIDRGRREGVLRADLPTWWLATSVVGVVYAAWEAIAEGRLAPRDAPDLVLSSVLDGAATR